MMHSRAGSSISLLSKQPIPLNQWVHITVTYDGSSRAAGTTLYVNAAPIEVDIARDNLTRTIIPNGNANQADQALGLAFGKRLRADAQGWGDRRGASVPYFLDPRRSASPARRWGGQPAGAAGPARGERPARRAGARGAHAGPQR